MTTKQTMFVAEYLKDFNATRAAKAAGYSENSACEIGNENLRKPQIKEAIQKYIDETLEIDRITLKRELLDELRPLAFSDIGIDVKRDRDGEVYEVSRRDKIRAIELLGKYVSMFTDKTELSTIDENGKPKGLEIVVKRANRS